MKKTLLITIAFISSYIKLSAGDDFCGIRNNAFDDEEKLTLPFITM